MNDSSMPSSESVQHAYRLPKQDYYYDKIDLFLCAHVTAYEASDSIQKHQDTLAAIVDELRNRTPGLKCMRMIKAWLNQIYATIIAVARKIPKNVLQEEPKLLIWKSISPTT